MKRFTTKRASQTRDPYPSGNSMGFTLVETMIAVTILTLAIAGPLFTANRALVAAQIARSQLTASYLAQEGIEYVRAMRDNEFLAAQGGADVSATAWANFLTNPTTSDSYTISGCKASTCMLDPTRPMGTGPSLSLQPCSGAACTPLFLANGIYTEQGNIVGATATPFTRTIQAIDVLANEERIVSTVSWNFHNTPYSVTITDHLTPWE